MCKESELMILTLPLPPEVLHPNGRTKKPMYRAKMIRKTRGETAFVARQHAPSQPFETATVQATFYLPRRRDGDGLNAWIKAVLDGLQDAGIVANDSGVTLLPPLQVTGKNVERRLELRIEGKAG